MSSPGFPQTQFSDAPSPIRWGIGDVLIVAVVQMVVATLAALPWLVTEPDGSLTVTVGSIVASLVAQNASIVGSLLILTRWKGRRSMASDFGVRWNAQEWWWYPVGFGLSMLAGILNWPLTLLAGTTERQAVADSIAEAQGVSLLLFAFAVIVLAPIGEELLFRGLLLRSLGRRMRPVWAVLLGALLFASFHALGDPSIGTLVAFPALMGLGTMNGFLAQRRSIVVPILVHAGFNTLAVLGILAWD